MSLEWKIEEEEGEFWFANERVVTLAPINRGFLSPVLRFAYKPDLSGLS